MKHSIDSVMLIFEPSPGSLYHSALRIVLWKWSRTTASQTYRTRLIIRRYQSLDYSNFRSLVYRETAQGTPPSIDLGLMQSDETWSYESNWSLKKGHCVSKHLDHPCWWRSLILGDWKDFIWSPRLFCRHGRLNESNNLVWFWFDPRCYMSVPVVSLLWVILVSA